MASPLADDYYGLLGVDADADGEALRRAWRELAARWHPDRAGLGATEMFQRISAAYEVLADPLSRAAYDRRRRGSRPLDSAAHRSPAATGSSARPGREPAPAVMLSRLCGNLASLLACGAARLDEPGFITLVLGDEEAARGGMAMIAMLVELWCPTCAGKKQPACARCGGNGTVEELFSAWLAVPPGVTAGEVLAPSVDLPGTVDPVRFRVRLRGAC